MIEALLGWAILAVALILPCAVVLEISHFILTRVRPAFKLRARTRVAAVTITAFGLWCIIPIVIHTMLGHLTH
jgi:hypothetical protein